MLGTALPAWSVMVADSCGSREVSVMTPGGGGFGDRSLNPAFDDFLFPDALFQQGDPFDRIVHPAASERVGYFQRCEFRFVREQCLVLNQGNGLLVEILNNGATIGGFSGRVGHRIDVIEAECFDCADLSVCQDAVIGTVIAIARADLIAGKHHGNRHERKVVYRATFQVSDDSLSAIHV
jgi:hypothetical protein